MPLLFPFGCPLYSCPSSQSQFLKPVIPVQTVPVDQFLHFRQWIFFVKQSAIAAAFTPLLHFTFQCGRSIGVMQHIRAAVADIAKAGQTQPNPEFGILITVRLAESGIKPANPQEVFPWTGHVDTDKRYAKEV